MPWSLQSLGLFLGNVSFVGNLDGVGGLDDYFITCC